MVEKLRNSLTEILGCEVWLDVHMQDKSESAMEEGIRNSKVIIAVLTDDGVEADRFTEKSQNAYLNRRLLVLILGTCMSIRRKGLSVGRNIR